jgi:hypothetical protein
MRLYPLAAFATVAVGLVVAAAPARQEHTKQGEGVTIVLENAFIKKYMDRATIETDFTPIAKSRVHPAKDDGEVHVGGIAAEAKLACVAEVMNAASSGKKATAVFATAIAQNKSVKVTGAWRLWCEHSGSVPQVQTADLMPPLPGPAPSNPQHVFEIHPVLSVKLADGQPVSAVNSVAATPGHRPKDAQTAFHLAYDRTTCKITPLPNDRTKIVTQAVGYNFTEFIIRLNRPPFELADGHAAEATVFDTDGELISHRRRMIFIKGTAANDALTALEDGKRLQVIGIPRINLKLIDWRVRNYMLPEFVDSKPLEWNLPYEMIVVSAIPVETDND